jgi:hypothetical protein
VNFTSLSSHVPSQPDPPPTFFQTTLKSEVVPSGLVSVPLIVCVFPSSEMVWVMELSSLPSFLITRKVNLEKSKFSGDQVKIQDLGGNKYRWMVGNISDTITYDGTDQPFNFGRTISMTPEGTNNWKIKPCSQYRSRIEDGLFQAA